jgi:hypothetical protein
VPPDVRIRRVSIVNVEISDFGVPPAAVNQEPIVTEVRMTFGDSRTRFTAPRGGRLRIGIVNPKKDAGADDTEDPTTSAGDRLNQVESVKMDRLQMVQACLKAMGETNVTAPAGLADYPAPEDVKWLGNHAPTELEKLLQGTRFVWCPRLDGTGAIEELGKGTGPAYTSEDALPSLSIPSVDRRGRTIIFSSYPARMVEYFTDLEGPADDGWAFVIRDSKGRWINPNTEEGFGTGWLHDAFADDFSKIDDATWRENLRSDAYRCIGYMGTEEHIGNILTRTLDKDGKLGPMKVTAKAVVQDRVTGLYKNSDDYVAAQATHVIGGRVLRLDRRLFKLSSKDPIPPEFLWDNLQELEGADPDPAKKHPSGDLRVTFSIELAEQDAGDGNGQNKKWRPRYYHAGFQKRAGGIVKLKDDEVANLLDGLGDDDAIVVPRTDLQAVVVGGQVANQQGLDDHARALAEGFLIGSGDPLVLRLARGFHPAEPSGLVSEVHWSQEKLLTTAYLRNWFAPTGALGDSRLLRELEGGENGGGGGGGSAYPNQGATEAGRKALGAGGAAQDVTPVQPGETDMVIGAGGGLAQIASPTPSTAASTRRASWRDGRQRRQGRAGGQGRAAVDAGGADGRARATSRRSSTTRWRTATRPATSRSGHVRPDPPHRLRQGQQEDRPGHLRPQLRALLLGRPDKDGGADAVWSGDTFTSPVSYTYTAKVAFGGPTLGKTMSPAIRLFTKVPTNPATFGFGCFLGAQFLLAFTDEKPSENACPPPS